MDRAIVLMYHNIVMNPPNAFGIGNLSEKREGLRKSLNDSECQEYRLTNDHFIILNAVRGWIGIMQGGCRNNVGRMIFF